VRGGPAYGHQDFICSCMVWMFGRMCVNFAIFVLESRPRHGAINNGVKPVHIL